MIRPARRAVALFALSLSAGSLLAVTSPAHAMGGAPGDFIIQKVDESGKLLPGAVIEGVTCTALDETSPWNCVPLSTYPGLMEEITATGQLVSEPSKGSGFWGLLLVSGSWGSRPIVQCMAFREKTPPSGYVPATEAVTVCFGPGGWTVENAEEVNFSTTFAEGEDPVTWGSGDWTVTTTQPVYPVFNEQGELVTPGVDGKTVLTLTNKKVARVAVPALAVTDPCGPGNAAYTVPSDTDVIDWSAQADGSVLATIKPEWTTFTDGSTTHGYGKPQDSGSACGYQLPGVDTGIPDDANLTSFASSSAVLPTAIMSLLILVAGALWGGLRHRSRRSA